MADNIVPNAPRFPFREVMKAESGDPYEGLHDIVPKVLQMYQQAKQKQQWQDTIGKMLADPNTSDGMKQVAMMMGADPSQARYMLPTFAKAELMPQGAKAGPQATVYQDPTGQQPPSPVAQPGWIPRKVSDSTALQYTTKKAATGMGSTPEGRDYLHKRGEQAEAGALSILDHNLDPSTATRTSPVGAAASSVRRVVNGLSLLQQPTVTRTALEATMGDIDSIVSQSGATVEGRKMLANPTLRANIQKYKAFVSSAPDKVPTDPGLVTLYGNILKDLGPLSENFVKDRIQNQARLFRKMGVSVTGSDQAYNQYVGNIINRFSIQPALDQSAASKQPSTGGWSYVGPAQ